MALFKVQVKEDVFRLLFFRDCVSEFLGSFFMVLFVAFLMVSLNTELYKPNTFQAGVTMGLNIFILIEAFGPISCHINPTVSFAWCLSGRITVFRAIFYTIFQVLGGAAAHGLTYLLCPPEERHQLYIWQPNARLHGDWRGMFVECLFIYLLVFTGLSTTDSDNRPVVNLPSYPTAFCVGTGIMAMGTWTGGLMNPMVAISPCFTHWDFTGQWIYWAGGYMGSILATLTYAIAIAIKHRDNRLKEAKEIKTEEEKYIKRGILELGSTASNHLNEDKEGYGKGGIMAESSAL